MFTIRFLIGTILAALFAWALFDFQPFAPVPTSRGRTGLAFFGHFIAFILFFVGGLIAMVVATIEFPAMHRSSTDEEEEARRKILAWISPTGLIWSSLASLYVLRVYRDGDITGVVTSVLLVLIGTCFLVIFSGTIRELQRDASIRRVLRKR